MMVLIAVGVCGNCKTTINISGSTQTKVISPTCPVCGCLTVVWYRSVNVHEG